MCVCVFFLNLFKGGNTDTKVFWKRCRALLDCFRENKRKKKKWAKVTTHLTPRARHISAEVLILKKSIKGKKREKMKWRKEKRHQEQIPTAKCAHQLKTRIYVHERKSSFAASRFEWSPSEVKGRGKGRKNVSFLKHPEYEEFLVVVVVRKSSNSGRIWRHDRTANVHGSFDAGIPDRWQTQVSRPKTRKSTKIRKKKKKKKMQFPEILSLSLSKRLRLVKVKGNNLMVRHIGRTLPFKKLHSAWLICLFQLLGIRRYTLETKRRKEIKMFLFWLFPPSEQTEAKMTALLCTHRKRREGKIYTLMPASFILPARIPSRGKEPLAGRSLFVSPFSFWFPFWPFHPRSRAPPTLLESNPASSRYIYLYNMSEWRDR